MNVSFQLFSARNFTPWADVLSTLAELGYTQVEGFGPLYDDPAATRATLDQLGLSMPSGHFAIEALEGDLPGVINAARTLGITRIVCPFLAQDDRPTDAAGWTAFAQRLKAIGDKLRPEGFTFGWHNHDFELEAQADGSIPMQIILDEAPENVWEADIAWVVRGGADPLDWIARHGNRITSAHVKDIAPAGENLDQDGWTEVGNGTVDWPGIMAALRDAGCDLFVIEHDNPADLTDFARTSIANFKSF